MKIIVVGAGIGGLAAAVALAKDGHSIDVYEQASTITEIGAGIQITPNASKQLIKWGVGKYLPDLEARAPCFKVRRWENGDVVGRMDTEGHKARFGGPYVQVHRADLQHGLMRLAQDHAVRIHTSSVVEAYDFDQPAAVLKDGRQLQADLIIAADGIRSVGRQQLCGAESLQTIPLGLAVVRASLPVDKIVDCPGVSHLVHEPGINLWVGPGRHAIAYVMRGESVVNLVFEYPEEHDLTKWDKVPYQDEVRRNFAGWDPHLRSMLDMIETNLKWSLRYSPMVDCWVTESGKFLLLGDAAHVVPSFLAQGAAMAIEDSALLARLLRSSNPISQVLQTWQCQRMERKSRVQYLSLRQLRLYDLEDGEMQRQRDGGCCSDQDLLPIWLSTDNQDWLYGYNVEEA